VVIFYRSFPLFLGEFEDYWPLAITLLKRLVPDEKANPCSTLIEAAA
jgi:hypothetical protein